MIESAPLRGQFNGLKDLIDAIASVTGAAVNTLPPGSNVTEAVRVIGNTLHFTFGIPQGNDGQQGPQGVPGEVTLAGLNNAALNMLSQSSANSNGVGMLSQVADSAYNQAQMQALFDKLDELINTLRR